ncbi:MAG: redoxin domain-containing protein, partial [Ignavibacteriales bacterium]|nr:redoxin domain-containing protein [Ignavibacteriales bacterium]
QVIGVSVDGVFANKAFAAQNNIQFPLLSDFKREAVAAYGLEHKDFSGLSGYTASKRSVFVIDKGGVVRYAWVSENPSVEPNYEEVTKAVAALK